MKPTSKFRILSTLCILILACANTACKKEKEPPPRAPLPGYTLVVESCNTFVVANRRVTSPTWLADFINKRACVVWHFEYEEQIYIFVLFENPVYIGNSYPEMYFFTCEGERILISGTFIWTSPMPTGGGLWGDLYRYVHISRLWHAYRFDESVLTIIYSYFLDYQ